MDFCILIVNDNFYIFSKTEMIGNGIIIGETVSVGTGISCPTFTPNPNLLEGLHFITIVWFDVIIWNSSFEEFSIQEIFKFME